jgi:hypothetical protein
MKQLLTLSGLIFCSQIFGQTQLRTIVPVVYAQADLYSKPDFISGDKIYSLKKGDSIPLIGFSKDVKDYAPFDYYQCYYGGQILYIETKTVEVEKEVVEVLKKGNKKDLLISNAIQFEETLNNSYIDKDKQLFPTKSTYSKIDIYDTTRTETKVGEIAEKTVFYLVSYSKNRSYYDYYTIVHKGKVYLVKDSYKFDISSDTKEYLQERNVRGKHLRISTTLEKSAIIDAENEARLLKEKQNSERLANEKEQLFLRMDSNYSLAKVTIGTNLLEDDLKTEKIEVADESIVFPFSFLYKDYSEYYEVYYKSVKGFLHSYSIELSDSTKLFLKERGEKNKGLRERQAKHYDSLYRVIETEKAKKLLSKYKQMQFVIQRYEIFSHNKYSEATDLTVDFFNGTSKTIKYIWFDFVPFNRVGDVVSDMGKTSKQVKGIGPIEPFSGGSLTFEYLFFKSIIECVKITAIKVQYTDGTTKSFNVASTLDDGVINNCK